MSVPEFAHEKGETEHRSEYASEEALEIAEVPAGYWRSAPFIGSILAGGFGMIGGTGAFALISPILSIIDADIGPDPNYFWVGVVNTLVLSVGFTLVGRLTDLFGRRYFVIGGNVLAVIGTIVAARGQTINVLIGAQVLAGVGAVVQTSVPFTMGEIVPMKYRYQTVAFMYMWSIPCAAFGPALAWGFVLHTAAGWRWCFYFMTITNGISTVLWILFYHPPSFEMKTTEHRRTILKNFDWVGVVLFSGGLICFLIGLSWGGSAYPWKSAHVIGMTVVGAVALIAFVLYEVFMPLKEPLVPMHLFKNIGWVVNIMVMGMAASCYYGFSIIFPQMVFDIYTSDLHTGSILACAAPASFLLGAIAAGASGIIGKQKYQVIVASFLAAPLLGAIACATVDNKATVLGLIITGSFSMGVVEGVAVASSGISLDNQDEIGAGVGVASTVRATWATVAVTVYVLVLRNRTTTTITAGVPPALIEAGLPATSIEAFITAISTGVFTAVPGITPAIIVAGVAAYKEALVLAFRTVFFTALAFLLTNCILSLFFPNLDHKLTMRVSAPLHKPHVHGHKDEKVSEVV